MDAKKKTIRNWLAVIVTVVFFAFQMYLALVKQLNPMLQSPLHLILALTLVFLYNPADKAYRKKVTKAAEAEGKPVDQKKLNAHAWMNWFDILLFICLAYMLWYVVGQNARLLDFVSVQPVYGIDYIFMVMTIVLLLIAVYRTLGIVLTIFIAVFILYAFTSPSITTPYSLCNLSSLTPPHAVSIEIPRSVTIINIRPIKMLLLLVFILFISFEKLFHI